MKIYFTAASDGNGFGKRCSEIIYQINKSGHALVSGMQLINRRFLDRDRKLGPAEIFRREKHQIEDADCVIAEVTKPSSGVGGEIVYALVHDKPVLALFYKDAENMLSPMIAGNPSEHLYLEHYDDDNLGLILKNFIDQISLEKKRVGKLIVIDGGDGSGKATQSELLIKYLELQGQKIKYMDFPRYYTSFHGNMVGRYLNGEFGKLNDINPYLASLAYALDRASAKEEMDGWLSRGGIIISNRYATSNMAHQASKLPVDKRKEFISWLDELEYKVHKIPREDVVIYLYVPWKIGYDLTLKKGSRKYSDGKLDIAEADIEHRKLTEEMYLDLARNRKNWVRIDCVRDGKILPVDIIHRMVVEALKIKRIIT
jgi:dTMP kinase